MNELKEWNDKKIRLKRYLGLLLAQSIDLTNFHEEVDSTHSIGDDQKCQICRQYRNLMKRINDVKQLIQATEQQTVIVKANQSVPKRRYYYICVDHERTIYVIRDKGIRDAEGWIPLEKRRDMKATRVSQARAFQVLQILDQKNRKDRINFLRHDNFYFGVVDKG